MSVARLHSCSTVALDALHDLTARVSAIPVFAAVTDRLRAATDDLANASTELRALGQSMLETARHQEEAAAQRSLAALSAAKAAVGHVAETAASLSAAVQSNVAVKRVMVRPVLPVATLVHGPAAAVPRVPSSTKVRPTVPSSMGWGVAYTSKMSFSASSRMR